MNHERLNQLLEELEYAEKHGGPITEIYAITRRLQRQIAAEMLKLRQWVALDGDGQPAGVVLPEEVDELESMGIRCARRVWFGSR